MDVLVVTGGIGSGKSSVCRILHERLGLPVYDADSRVKALYREHPSLLADIEDALGCVLRDSEGRFLPERLAGRIFSSPSDMDKVEGLVFPALKDDFREFASSLPEDTIVVFESATVLEKPQFDGFGDKVLFVDAPEDTRLGRACLRDGSSREKIRARMDSQKAAAKDRTHHDRRIDTVLVNDGDLQELVSKTEDAFVAMFGASAWAGHAGRGEPRREDACPV